MVNTTIALGHISNNEDQEEESIIFREVIHINGDVEILHQNPMEEYDVQFEANKEEYYSIELQRKRVLQGIGTEKIKP